MKSYSVLFLIAFARVASACLNGYEPNEVDVAHSHSLVGELTYHQLKEPWTGVRDRLREKLKDSSTFEVQNDLAVALLHTGETAEAISLLTQVETDHPGAYQTASNLGTAYELAGDNANALKWIQEGIRRNPDSHGGSEWVHVGILQAKISMGSDPEWLNTHSPLDLEVRKADEFWVKSSGFPKDNEGRFFWVPSPDLPKDNEGRVQSLRQCIGALRIQLHERLQFTPTPNPLIGRLILEYADLLEKAGEKPKGLIGLYQLALNYAPNDHTAEVNLGPARWQLLAEGIHKPEPWWSAEASAIGKCFLILLATPCLLIVARNVCAWFQARSKNS